MNKFTITSVQNGKTVVSSFATLEAAKAAAEILYQETGAIAGIGERRPAQLLLTGHRLTLLVDGQPVAEAGPTKTSIGNLKRYLHSHRDRLAFTKNCFITFPWLREIVAD